MGEIMSDFKVEFKENGKIKLLIIVGTRPEIIRLASVIRMCISDYSLIWLIFY